LAPVDTHVGQAEDCAPVATGPAHADLSWKRSIGRTTAVAVENDLAELKGIGPKHAAMLKVIETRHGTVVGLSEKTVEGWIEEAKAHEV
jgi:hypothetical protein